VKISLHGFYFWEKVNRLGSWKNCLGKPGKSGGQKTARVGRRNDQVVQKTAQVSRRSDRVGPKTAQVSRRIARLPLPSRRI